MRALVWVVVVVTIAASARADDLRTAEQLAWKKRFGEAEAMYRRILQRQPQSQAARLGLARVVMWQGRYAEAIELFERVEGIDALEGKATAEYWSGDLRGAARDFRRVLERDSRREFARRSLAEIEATARPWQRIDFYGTQDDQPLDGVRSDATATFFSDPLTRWSVTAGAYRLDAGRIGRGSGPYARVANETRWRDFTFGGSVGVFTFPDGVRRPIGSASVRHRSLTLRVDHREEIASATALRTHAASTMTALRWDRDRDWIGAAEVSHRRYFDGNAQRAAVAYAVVPLTWSGGRFGRRTTEPDSGSRSTTMWLGGSIAFRDTDQSRFRITAVSATREQNYFRYQYRGEYDPYWTPDDLREARVVLAVERRIARGTLKLHADAGYARDRGRAFGPDVGPGPFPASSFTFAFDRAYHPWRAGITADFAIARSYRIEAGIERGATVDYRSTSFHAALVRRR